MASYIETLLGTEPGEGPVVQPHRVLLFDIVGRALRAEAGVRERKAERKSTEYHAGRRSAFIASAAQLMATLYGGDYEAAKHALAASVKTVGEGFPPEEILSEHQAFAKDVTEHVLKTI